MAIVLPQVDGSAMSAAFDTLQLARRLRDQDLFTSAQAERLADAMAEMVNSDMATKTGLRETELRLEATIEASKAEIEKWLFGMIGFQTVIILGAAIMLARAIAR